MGSIPSCGNASDANLHARVCTVLHYSADTHIDIVLGLVMVMVIVMDMVVTSSVGGLDTKTLQYCLITGSKQQQRQCQHDNCRK